jgi:hypothetical protein
VKCQGVRRMLLCQPTPNLFPCPAPSLVLCLVVGLLAAANPMAANAQSASLVFTTATGALAGIAAPGSIAQGGFDEEIALKGRMNTGPVRASALISASLSSGYAALARWYGSSSTQTMRFSWPGWTKGALAPDVLAAIEIQELALAVSAGHLRFEAGKFPLKWGVGKASRPSDIFRTMDYTSLIPVSKNLPAVRFSIFPSSMSRIEALASIDGDSTITAGARYFTSISMGGSANGGLTGGLSGGASSPFFVSEVGSFALSAGWRRKQGSADEFAGSFELQVDAGPFAPYTEFSARTTDSTAYALAMLGTSLAISDLSLTMEAQTALGQSSAGTQLFFLGTWKASDLTSISFPVFWLADAHILAASSIAQFQGILGGRLDFSATASWIFAGSPASFLWKIGAYWTRSLSTY